MQIARVDRDPDLVTEPELDVGREGRDEVRTGADDALLVLGALGELLVDRVRLALDLACVHLEVRHRLAAEGLDRRVTFVPVPIWLAKGGLRAFRVFDRLALNGKFAVASEGSLSFMSRDNPFTSDRAKSELGWNPSVRPEVGIPGAFRWWKEKGRVV